MFTSGQSSIPLDVADGTTWNTSRRTIEANIDFPRYGQANTTSLQWLTPMVASSPDLPEEAVRSC
jgi:hypothetical protein